MPLPSWSSHEFAADGKPGPTPRSIAALLPVSGAGKMLSDVWVFDIEGKTWEEVDVMGGVPDARGWFDADIFGEDAIVVQGGLGEDNVRLRDCGLEFED
ncbi:Kelch repeat protein [Aspergillus glaucus CBS 516.65]|uniref:Uncharacterized protein n=1 Tax=Aspergillus glaucus CBS 516.65 TaxID=1160497 RepID=A0A1L9V4J2_ASPGL|nr:hypothetical protein ASPGLDRAFT_40436 [Aspergillus glaucus CBS 516.65]OJJ78830.1 hypothetical protein ASPGLDRAFT_40436 [Aspergillus glaucus CBS 516.65]